MQIEEKEKKSDEMIRCVECRKEYSLAYIEEIEASKCPGCGTESLPLAVSQDTTIKINWHELRILAIWAKNWQDYQLNKPKESEPEGKKTIVVDRILVELEKQRPEGAASLSILGELKELADTFNTKVTMIDANGGTVIEKKTVH